MSNLPDAALATRLSSLPSTATGQKVRVLGKYVLLFYLNPKYALHFQVSRRSAVEEC